MVFSDAAEIGYWTMQKPLLSARFTPFMGLLSVYSNIQIEYEYNGLGL